MQNLPWFAIHLRSNFERVSSQALEARGFTTFLPTYRSRRTWSDRIQEIDAPLFAGYTFCQLNPRQKTAVLQTPGVINIVGVGSEPVPIQDSEIDALKAISKSGLIVGPWPSLREGEPVILKRGPLEGVEGLVLKVKNKHRLIVSVSLMQRAVSVEIDRAWVSPVSRNPRSASSSLN